MVCHRRAGKTVACVNDLIARAVYTQKKNARFGYIAPFYRQAKEIAWEYLKEYAGEASVKAKESSLSVELFNGAKIQLFGADNPDSLRGLYFDGIILDEFGDCRPSLWGTSVLPTLSDRKGWAVFIGTPKGKNHFFEMWERAEQAGNWFHFMLKASMSGLLDAEELAEMRAQMTEEEYQQEFECDFTAAVRGTYYASLINKLDEAGHFTTVPWDPTQPVQAVSDLGYTDSTAWWFWQYRPDGVAVIDYYEAEGKSLAHYFDVLRNKPYTYEHLYLPHDARAKTLQTGRSTIEQFKDHFHKKDDPLIQIVPNLKKQHGIDAARKMLPHCWFDAEATKDGVDGLKSYRRKWDEVRKVFSNEPMHDWASNPSDAFRYLCLVASERIMPKKQIVTLEDQIKKLNEPPRYHLEELFADREAALNIGSRRI